MLAYIDQVDDLKFPGVANKIASQIEAFRNSGIDCERVHLPYNRSVLIQVLRRLPLMPDWYGWETVSVEKYSAFYIRRPYFISPSFISFLRRIKIANPEAKVMLELPTYPYDDEMKGYSSFPLLVRDRANRKKLRKYIDRVCSFSVPDRVFGIPTVSICNGIDVDRIALRVPKFQDDPIELLCLAMFAKWHGVDRLICGLADYYDRNGKRDFILHLIGDGPEIPELHRLVDERKIGDHIVFHGTMKEDQYVSLFDRCAAAVASLGMHRIGIAYASTLKTREYLARGIPFIYSGAIDVFEQSPADFCMQIPADDSAVDFDGVQQFLENLYRNESKESLSVRIRTYAKETVDMKVALAPVIRFFMNSASND